MVDENCDEQVADDNFILLGQMICSCLFFDAKMGDDHFMFFFWKQDLGDGSVIGMRVDTWLVQHGRTQRNLTVACMWTRAATVFCFKASASSDVASDDATRLVFRSLGQLQSTRRSLRRSAYHRIGLSWTRDGVQLGRGRASAKRPRTARVWDSKTAWSIDVWPMMPYR